MRDSRLRGNDKEGRENDEEGREGDGVLKRVLEQAYGNALTPTVCKEEKLLVLRSRAGRLQRRT